MVVRIQPEKSIPRPRQRVTDALFGHYFFALREVPIWRISDTRKRKSLRDFYFHLIRRVKDIWHILNNCVGDGNLVKCKKRTGTVPVLF
jgi:hypothetical protein